MAELSHKDYDALEGAIIHGRRLAITRRGTEYVVVPLRLRIEGGREALDTRHPTTGERMTLYVDEMDAVEVVR